MEIFYSEQINNMLQRYYFNCEDNPKGKESHYGVLACGVQNLYSLAFCSYDDEALNFLRPFIDSICDGEVPQPVYLGYTG